MKPDDSRIPLKHDHEHAVPTVIHDTEEDLPALARWLKHAMENPVQFWGGLGVLVAVLLGLSVLGNGLRSSRQASDEAWSKLESAKTPAERIEIAKEFPKTPAERWALLQAATEYYSQGFNDLPANRDVALPTLRKALDTFEKVAADAPEDSPQARAASLGVARTLEARNELDKALKQYEKVAANKAWAGTSEAKDAARLAAILKKPETAAFYRDLYAYKAPEATIPAGGTGTIDLPFPTGGLGGSGGTGLGGLGGTGAGSSPFTLPDPSRGTGVSPIKLPDISNLPPPPPMPAVAPAPAPLPKAETPAGKTIELTPSPAPKAETPKADTPKVEPGGLPADPFAPAPK